MTQEEKAKAYDRVSKEVKDFFEGRQKMYSDVTQTLEYLFPELKKSEDEKIRKGLINYFNDFTLPTFGGLESKKILSWLEKQGNKVIDFPQNHKDMNNPNGCIVLEDLNGGEGFYKLHLDYLNKKQVEEIEKMIRTWNKESILNYGRP